MPPDRAWPQKCDRCLSKGLECSPNSNKKAGGSIRHKKISSREYSIALTGNLLRPIVIDETAETPNDRAFLTSPDFEFPPHSLSSEQPLELSERIEAWVSEVEPGPVDQLPTSTYRDWLANDFVLLDGTTSSREIPLGDKTRNNATGGWYHKLLEARLNLTDLDQPSALWPCEPRDLDR